jgi:uncharacterized protein YciI
MGLYAVVREAGPEWTDGRGAFDQPGVQAHAAFMDDLASERFVLCAGPLAGSESGRMRALVIIDASDEDEVKERLGRDPWARAERLVNTSIEPWTLFVGADRLPGVRTP